MNDVSSESLTKSFVCQIHGLKLVQKYMNSHVSGLFPDPSCSPEVRRLRPLADSLDSALSSCGGINTLRRRPKYPNRMGFRASRFLLQMRP
ncbi:hypothetical protein CDAR_15501 [Caerostris darwini]|uniref:Uncharacterized protein n=1 Tax=Caerostris darwini TaxID=1538125 RepID=A0AAV4S9B7_9ARAC|nr:hypothetical protein CDAR_15501 [Caerostris darwini]